MRASAEYLVAGLPIVSTPSVGGRDVFFDPDYCLIAAPNPRDIRQAVETLKSRDIPRDYIRLRTLAKLAPERHRFTALVESIGNRMGSPRKYETEWKYSGAYFHKWWNVRDLFEIVERG
jgi:glycosyltransferase involved in cell wall biosynthesis